MPRHDLPAGDWRRLAGFAMTRLGWPPEVFWSATPQDLLTALDTAARPTPQPMSREELAALRMRFPDRGRKYLGPETGPC